ncbi:MAG: hypothetical protein M8467_10190 [Anaerolineae bacterium]|nr:hypothetical protein [Anaerolineae bacterium]
MSRVEKVAIFGVAAILSACALACALFVAFLAHYQPAVVAAPGYDMHWPTQPAEAWAAITKSYQSFVETRTCEYTVLGWSAKGTLYYQETCVDHNPQIWSYDPDSENEPRAVEASPPDLFQQAVPRRAILDWVRVPQVRPADAEPSVRRLGVRVDGLASPDGRRVAVVVRHLYGPEDVLVLESEADGVPLVDVPDYGLTQLLRDLQDDDSQKLSFRETIQPVDLYQDSYAYESFEWMLENADVIAAGKVLAIGQTRWNQDNGEYWEESLQDDSGSETVVSATPCYTLTLSVDRLLVGSLGLKEDRLVTTVVGVSPLDQPAATPPFHPRIGDEIVAFVRRGEIGWYNGDIRYDPEGGFEIGRKTALLFVGGPDNAHLITNGQGLYYRPSATQSPFAPAAELTRAISLDELATMVGEKRAAPVLPQ